MKGTKENTTYACGSIQARSLNHQCNSAQINTDHDPYPKQNISQSKRDDHSCTSRWTNRRRQRYDEQQKQRCRQLLQSGKQHRRHRRPRAKQRRRHRTLAAADPTSHPRSRSKAGQIGVDLSGTTGTTKMKVGTATRHSLAICYLFFRTCRRV